MTKRINRGEIWLSRSPWEWIGFHFISDFNQILIAANCLGVEIGIQRFRYKAKSVEKRVINLGIKRK